MLTAATIVVFAVAGGAIYRCATNPRLSSNFYVHYCCDSDDDSLTSEAAYGVDTIDECKAILEKSDRVMWISQK